MQPTETLAKILNIREKEKKDAQLAHHESIVYFEGISTKLYAMVNRKEDAEGLYEESVKGLTSIDKMREQVEYIAAINQQIVTMQKQMNEARNTMEATQLKLTDAHVEVKKFEKIIELRKNEQLMSAHREEQIMMDEISTQQFVSRRLGG